MSIKDSELLEKFQAAVKSKLDEAAAINFFSKLKPEEYDRLIEIFTNNEFPNINNQTKEKLLIILKKLKAVL